jgi:transposase
VENHILSKPPVLTREAQVFLTPSNATQRQYEALRAYFVDRLPGTEVAKRFGYTPGSFRVLVHQFRQRPDRPFFATPSGQGAMSRKDPLHERIVKLRKQNQSIYDISNALKKEGVRRSPVSVAEVLRREGFAKLPRRRDEERPLVTRPTAADRADVRELSLEPRTIRTKFGGLFLFLPALAALPFDRLIRRSGLPGTKMVPAGKRPPGP